MERTDEPAADDPEQPPRPAPIGTTAGLQASDVTTTQPD
jgi:hypothetical protein